MNTAETSVRANRIANASASDSVSVSGTTMRTSASSLRRLIAASRSRSHFTPYSSCATRPRPWYQ